MKSRLFVLAALLLYALHQDFFLWRSVRPLLFGFLPIGLAYHAAYCALCSLLLYGLTTKAWPRHLEDAASRDPE